MSFYYTGSELCPEANFTAEEALERLGAMPLLFLWESFPALILPGEGISRLPVYCGSPPMLGGRGTMFFSLFAENAQELCFTIIRDALLRLDVAAEIRGESIYAAGYPCGLGKHFPDRKLFRGALYYAAPQEELNRCSQNIGHFMSLSAVNPNLSRSYLFGAVKYAFELRCGKAERVSLSEPVQTLRIPSL